MTDLISREAAIALLERLAQGWDLQMKPGPMPHRYYIEALTNMPSAGWFPLSVDDAETELFFCLKNMLGNPTDDKALLAQMRERGLWVFARNGWSSEE